MEYKILPKRYVLSPFPILLAVLSRLCGGLHPAVMAHTVYPVAFFTAAYLVYHQFGKMWFPEKKREQGIFLLFCAVLIWFSGFSVYTAGNFQLVRIWQGKAVLAAVILPLLFYYLLCAYKNEYQIQDIIQIFLTTGAAALTSSMGIFLAPIMVALGAFAGIIQTRKIGIAWKLLAGCIPCIILTGIYLLLRVEGMG